MDFFPRCEYLGKASKVCAADGPQAWLDGQKGRLKANQSAAVLDALAPFVEVDSDDPVTACDRYLRSRPDQLDDQGAIQRGLPISHGEGVERVFQTYSLAIADISVKRRGDARRAKLYYLRGLEGKAARIKEKLL